MMFTIMWVFFVNFAHIPRYVPPILSILQESRLVVPTVISFRDGTLVSFAQRRTRADMQLSDALLLGKALPDCASLVQSPYLSLPFVSYDALRLAAGVAL